MYAVNVAYEKPDRFGCVSFQSSSHCATQFLVHWGFHRIAGGNKFLSKRWAHNPRDTVFSIILSRALKLHLSTEDWVRLTEVTGTIFFIVCIVVKKTNLAPRGETKPVGLIESLGM